MPIMLVNGEWAELVDKWKTYDYARNTGAKEHAAGIQKTTFGVTRTMLPAGLAAYIDIPESLKDRVTTNDKYYPENGYLNHITDKVAAQHGAETRYWTGGLFRPTESAIRNVLGARDYTPVWELADNLDLSKCDKEGPLLYVHGKTVRFQGTSKEEWLPFLAAIYDPHAYGFTATDPGRAHEVRPGFRGSATGYMPAVGQGQWEDGTKAGQLR
jgi:hypothetical protein